MKKLLDGFKEFILRGNVVDLAVGIMIGASFNTVINGLVKDLLTPLIAAIASQPNFSNLAFMLHGSAIMYGDFLNVLISFLITAFAVYFFVVLPVNALLHKMHREEAPADPTNKKCPYCLSDIPLAATRCAYCTSNL